MNYSFRVTPNCLRLLGRLAIAHTHLELILRYTVKTLSGLKVKEALDATNRVYTSEVRRIIRRLFKELRPSPSEQIELESLRGAADRLTKKRNDFLHSAWSQTDAGILF